MTISNLKNWFVSLFKTFECRITLADTFVKIDIYQNENCLSKFLYRGKNFNECIFLAKEFFKVYANNC